MNTDSDAASGITTRTRNPRRHGSRTTTIEEAGRLLGLGRQAAYEAARRGDFPVPIVKVGRRLLVPIGPLERLLSEGRL